MGVHSMKSYCVLVCSALFLTACGSAGTVSTANNVTMQGGQWEFAVAPTDGSSPFYIDMNLSTTNGPLSVSNASIYNSAVVGLPHADAPIYCGSFNLAGAISQATLKGNLTWGQATSRFASLAGILASDGKSFSQGSYSGQSCTLSASPVSSGPHTEAVLTGYLVPPVNGTFTGILNSSLHGPATVTLSITQNPDFTLAFSGTLVENGVTSMLTPLANPASAAVTGATIGLGGTATSVNGSSPVDFAGHLNSQATQITVTNMSSGSDELFTGSLTRQ